MSDPQLTGNPEFVKAADDAKRLPTKPTDDQLLKLYSLFKQAIIGDNTTEKPGLFDLKGKAKWNAWDSLKGMKKTEAQQEYIALVRHLESQ